jgi:hypothetical protein
MARIIQLGLRRVVLDTGERNMTKQIQCPAEGCDYENVVESVAGHAQAKRDPPHKGISYRDVMDDHAEGNGDSGGSNTERSTPSSTSTTTTNPTVGNGNVSGSDSGTDMDSAGSGRYELPCGHETFAWADVPDRAIKTKDGVRMTMVGCDTCEGEWVVTDE